MLAEAATHAETHDDSHEGPPPSHGHGDTRDGERPRHPARRSPWNRPRDRVAATVLVVVTLAVIGLVWTFSDSRATTQQTAPPAPALPPAPPAVPGAVSEVWRAPSPATPVPVSAGNAVVTADGGQVSGRDPLTGEVRWRYARDLPLCTVASAWSRVLAVYRKDTGCSEVTELDAGTGRRTAQRNGDAELGTRLVGDGSHVTTTGTHLLNTWRDDLVKTLEYGRVPAPVQPDRQPRSGCTYGTVAATDDTVGVIEHCPGESGARFTVLKAAGEDADKPEQEFSVLLPGRSAHLVTMSGDAAAVVVPEHRQLLVFDHEGRQRAAYPLDVPTSELAAEPPAGVVPTADSETNVYWFTGRRTIALSGPDLVPRWAVQSTLGPGTMFAGQYVVPIAGGLAVLDEQTGATIRTVAVDRYGYDGPVPLASAGPLLLEQRGTTVVALR